MTVSYTALPKVAYRAEPQKLHFELELVILIGKSTTLLQNIRPKLPQTLPAARPLVTGSQAAR